VSMSRRMFGSLCPCNVRLHLIMHRTIRLMPSFQHSVAVLPFRCYTNSVSAIWITLLTLKNLLCRCRCHLPLCRNCHSVASRIESYFCHSAVGGQPISIVVSSSLWIRKDVSSISVLTRNCNGSYETEEWQRYNGTAQRNGEMATAKRQRQNGNGMVETRHNGLYQTPNTNPNTKCSTSPLVRRIIKCNHVMSIDLLWHLRNYHNKSIIT